MVTIKVAGSIKPLLLNLQLKPTIRCAREHGPAIKADPPVPRGFLGCIRHGCGFCWGSGLGFDLDMLNVFGSVVCVFLDFFLLCVVCNFAFERSVMYYAYCFVWGRLNINLILRCCFGWLLYFYDYAVNAVWSKKCVLLITVFL